MATIKVSKLGGSVMETVVREGESVGDILNRLDVDVSKTDQIRFNNKSIGNIDAVTESGTLVISQRVEGA